jgi:uncharacterized protein (UPF0333 family)
MASTNVSLLLPAVILLGLIVYYYMSSKSTSNYENAVPNSAQSSLRNDAGGAAAFALSSDAQPSSSSVMGSADLLPKDSNTNWASNTEGDGALTGVTLFKAGQMLGIQGNTLKNANLQLRSEPPIPKSNIGPWNQSTIESDPYRVCLELGCSKN